MNEQQENFKPTFQLASKLAAIKASPSGQHTPTIDISRVTVPHYLIKDCEALSAQSKKLAHRLSQPMTVLLTTLEIGALGSGLDAETAQLLFEQVLQMRNELKNFSEVASGIYSRF